MKKTIIIISIVLLAMTSVFATEAYYAKGDTVFSFRAGVDFPLFMDFVNDSSKGMQTFFNGTHTKLGGYASLAYQGYISEKWALGAEIGYAFNNTEEKETFSQIPITAKLTYVPVQTGKFDLNLHANAGFLILKYENKQIAPFAQISINPVYYFSDSWGLGLDAGVWLWYEAYSKTSSNNKYNHNCLGSYAPITLSLCYRH